MRAHPRVGVRPHSCAVGTSGVEIGGDHVRDPCQCLLVVGLDADLGAVLGARAQVLETRLRLIDLQAQRDGVTTRLNSLIAD